MSWTRNRSSMMGLLVACLPIAVACGGSAGHKQPGTGIPYQAPAPPPVFQPVPADENTGLIAATPPDTPTSGTAYHLEVDDHLDISVYGEESLQHVEVPVRPDGMISFAFIGDVMAAGRT